MKIIYRARDLTEAHIISGLLNANDISTHVGGHYLQGGIGELAASDFVTIHVKDEDINSATSIIAEYEATDLTAKNSTIKHSPVKHSTTKKHSNYLLPFIILLFSILMITISSYLFGCSQ